MESQQLQRAEQMTAILSMVLTSSGQSGSHIIRLIGRVELKILYFCLSIPITRSTCIHTRASCRVVSTSHGLSCGLPFVKDGIFTSAM